MKGIKRLIFMFRLVVVVLLLSVFSCNDGIEVQQAYPFTVETMPVQTKITKGETAEIRCTLKRAERFEGTRYTIRYFQTDGEGQLAMDDGEILLPNDRYQLSKEVFRLYYTAVSTDQQKIDIYLEDNFGQVVTLSFSFANVSKDEG